MTIQELLDAAARVDPKVSYTAHDRVDYKSKSLPKRDVVVYATSSEYGEGSCENIAHIALRMGGLGGQSQHVLEVVPGKTSQYWQVAPLVKALESERVQAELAR